MPQAYIIEVESRTAGIVARDERGYRFFSSDRLFDGLEGRQFRSARDAQRAARALLQERRHVMINPAPLVLIDQSNSCNFHGDRGEMSTQQPDYRYLFSS